MEDSLTKNCVGMADKMREGRRERERKEGETLSK
jgi:hypothetical protein